MLNEKYNQFKERDFPDFVINAISDIISQYVLEHQVSNKDVVLRFSKFSEAVVKELQNGMIESHNDKLNDINYIKEVLLKRKKLMKNNYDLYEQLEHLSTFNVPDYAIDSIVNAVNEVCLSDELSSIENRDFYCLFGENIILDLRNYMQLNQIEKLSKKN